jgi:glycosyltransferase involved in cell wall biosynthesis
LTLRPRGAFFNAMHDPSSLRVAIFSDSMPERNGAGAYYHDLLSQLSTRVEAVEIFQPVQKGRLLKLALPLPGDATQKLITPNVFRIRNAFKQLQPHVVVAVTPGPFGLLGLYLARSSKSAFITGFHTHFEQLVKLYGDTLFMKISHEYLVFINKVLCKRSNSVMVNNGDLVKVVEQLGARQVKVMGTPLSDAFLGSRPVPPRPDFADILFAGRLAPEKNLEPVIAAAKALPHLQFVFAGEGPLRKKLMEETEGWSNVRFTGWLGRDALKEEMDKANLLLLPSHHETFGTVALEMMARGRPAIVSENAGIHHWSLLKDSLFVLRNGQSLTELLVRLGKEPPLFWQEIAEKSHQAARQLHDETIEAWLTYLSETAA